MSKNPFVISLKIAKSLRNDYHLHNIQSAEWSSSINLHNIWRNHPAPNWTSLQRWFDNCRICKAGNLFCFKETNKQTTSYRYRSWKWGESTWIDKGKTKQTKANYLLPFAQFVVWSQQHMNAIRTNDANNNGTGKTDHVTRSSKCLIEK